MHFDPSSKTLVHIFSAVYIKRYQKKTCFAINEKNVKVIVDFILIVLKSDSTTTTTNHTFDNEILRKEITGFRTDIKTEQKIEVKLEMIHPRR